MSMLTAKSIVETCCGISRRVDRWTYAITGVVLTLVKYGVEVAAFWLLAGVLLTPWEFVNPLLGAREAILRPAPPWLPAILYLWTLPFLWIAVSMSIRRAADAGFSPWVGFGVLVPLMNLPLMLVLCVLPSVAGKSWHISRMTGEERPWHAALAVGFSVIVGGLMVVTSVYLLASYGTSLFLGTPVLMGASAAYVYNRSEPRSFLASAGIGAVSVVAGCAAMLLFAAEGIFCLAMALPLAMPVAALGGILGKAIADVSRSPVGMVGALIVLPLWATGESLIAIAPERIVLTTLEIDAAPQIVWQNVIAFPELPAERDWYFRLGIACPERARISGQGVGAIRYCEFTTGTFVEPITVWDEPRRLAFDVTEQPAPMFELSPYRHVHAPHLDGFLTSTQGEFRLVALDGGRTRLEGRTWYRNEMYPQWYWPLWSDLLIHRIHERVLLHIQRLSEHENGSDSSD